MTALAAEVRPSDQDTDDLELVAGVRAGHDRAFEALYERYEPRIALYVRRMVCDHGRAEDVTQEVFISALRRMRETEREIAFKPWIYEIAKNACIDAFRRSRRCNEVSFDAEDSLAAGDRGRLAELGARPDVAVDTKLDLDNLCGAFGGLSEAHHQILVMRELEGLSYRDIGQRLGMSRPAVESTLFRARRRLEEEYAELASGKRCMRVRSIIDAGGRSTSARDRRRLNRHVSRCRPCRRHAVMAGVDLDARPARPPVAARIAVLLPLPALWRRPVADDAPAQALGSPGHATVAQWSASVASTVDPATAGGWGKALAVAASIAVAGAGAGTAIKQRDALRDFVSPAPAVAGSGGSSERGAEGSAALQGARSTALERRRAALARERRAARKSGRPSSAGGADGRGRSAADAAARPSTSSGAPGSAPKSPQPDGRGSSVKGPSGGVGALLDKTLGGKRGVGGRGTGSVSGVTSAVEGLGGARDGAPSGLSGSAGAATTGAGARAGPVQGIVGRVTRSVDRTLAGT